MASGTINSPILIETNVTVNRIAMTGGALCSIGLKQGYELLSFVCTNGYIKYFDKEASGYNFGMCDYLGNNTTTGGSNKFNFVWIKV